ncbi:MAG: hypothetical protein ACRETC_06435 [Gammaproteobacteria bacterium]
MAKRSKTKLKSVPRGHTPKHPPAPRKPQRTPAVAASDRPWYEDRYLWWIALAALLAVTWFVYHNGLTSGWFLDDYGNIVNNGALALPNLSLPTLWHAVWSFNAGPLGRPISLATFAIERYLYGLDPYVFKFTNLMLHLATALLIAGFTRSLLGAWRTRFAPDTKAWRVEWIALAIAACWALHPMNLTPVLYAVQRETILGNLFMVAGLWSYVAIRRHYSTNWITVGLLTVITLVFTALAALSKEIGVLLPLLVLLVEFFVLGFRDRDETRARKLWLFYLLVLVIPAIIGFWWAWPHLTSSHAYVSRDFDMGERILTEGRIVVWYLGLVVAPRLSAMGLYHDDFTISTGLLSPPTTLLSFLLIAALFALAWWLRKRRPLVALGIIWFFACQLLESTIWPLELAFEHRIYLADWGIILAVFALVILPLRRLNWRRAGVVLSIAAIIGLAAITYQRAWHWRSNLALAKVLAHNHPQSPRSTYLLARLYTNRALGGHEMYAEPAFEAARTATRVPHAGLDPWVAMILLAAQTGRHVEPSWFDGMVKTVGEGPLTVSDVNALEALVNCYSRHQCKITRGSLDRLFKAIYRSPRITQLGMNYANVLVTQANMIGYGTVAERARSGPLLIKAAKAVPYVAQFQVNVFNIELEDGHIAAARQAFENIRKLNKLGKLDYTLDRLRPHLEAAERRAQAPPPPATTP